VLVEFLRVDIDLLAEAVSKSPPAPAAPPPGDLEKWVLSLPVGEKDSILARLAAGEGSYLRAELVRNFQLASAPKFEAVAGGRTYRELLDAAEARGQIRVREEQARAAAEAERRRRAEAEAREKYLATPSGKEEQLWKEIEQQIELSLAGPYARAVELLVDLRDLSVRQKDEAAFAERFNTLMEKNPKRAGLRKRLTTAGFRM
jgi:hypothetical protein